MDTVVIVIKERPIKDIAVNNVPLTYNTIEAVFTNEDDANQYIKARKALKDRDDRSSTFKKEFWHVS